MTKLLNRLHAKLGDFWWYSLMVFAAESDMELLIPLPIRKHTFAAR